MVLSDGEECNKGEVCNDEEDFFQSIFSTKITTRLHLQRIKASLRLSFSFPPNNLPSFRAFHLASSAEMIHQE